MESNNELTMEEKANIARSAYMHVSNKSKYADEKARLERNAKKRIWNSEHKEKIKQQQIEYWAKKFDEAANGSNKGGK